MSIARNFARFVLATSMTVGLLGAAGTAAQAAQHGHHDSADTQKYEVKKQPDGTFKYCTQMPEVTGSRIRPVVCKTQQEWKEVGVELNIG